MFEVVSVMVKLLRFFREGFKLFLEGWRCFRKCLSFSGGVGIFSVVLKLSLFSGITFFWGGGGEADIFPKA